LVVVGWSWFVFVCVLFFVDWVVYIGSLGLV
jgi:hypothetical protein